MNNENNENSELLDSEVESKVTLRSRSKDRAHSTENGGDDPITEINVTPLVDVALVLVIIFMVVSPFMVQAGLKVTESKAGAATGKSSLSENLQVTLTPEGKIRIDQKEILISDLENELKQRLPKTKDQLVTVQADQKNLVGQVVEILDIAKQAGAKKVAILNKLSEE